MATVRVALIGCGHHGQRVHLTAYQKVIAEGEDARLVAVCDHNSERAKQAADQIPGAHWYHDYRDLLEHERPDAVSLATPPAFHREQAVAAIRSGAHVLCEKPLAMNRTEAQEILATAEQCSRIVTMGLQHRYSAAAQCLRGVLAGGEFGQVYHTRLWCGHVWTLPPSPHFFQASLAGGGVVAATAVHWLDLTLWLLGNPAARTVSAATFAKTPHLRAAPPPFRNTPEAASFLASDDVEDFATAWIRFVDGSTLSLEASWLQHQTERRAGIQFLAEHGVVEHLPLALRWDGDGEIVDRTPSDLPAIDRGPSSFLPVVRDFLQAARTGQPTLIRGTQMLQVQDIIDAIYISAQRQCEVTL